MRFKEIAAAIMMLVGIILAIGAVGTMDFLGTAATEADMTRETIKAVIAGALMIASLMIAVNVEENSED